MLVLAIESSCDETAAAVVRDGRDILSNVVASQIDVHSRYGGVVPELASRQHLEAIPLVISEALDKAGVTLEQIEGIVVTRGPGLVGALLVGVSAGKALSYAQGVPLVGVHHIEGHVLAIQLEKDVRYPYIALAVSGGHTHLYLVEGVGRYRTLGRTLDDAAGEAFDKVGKLLGLPYPGGIAIDRLAREGDPAVIEFPRPLLHQDNLDFSFSGIKTAVMNRVRQMPLPLGETELRNVAAGFQQAVVEVLCRKTLKAVEQTGIERVVISGGVACNSGLRRQFGELAAEQGLEAHFPSPQLCSDNAAMLAVAGNHYLERGATASLDLNAVSSWPLDRAGNGLP